MRKPNWHNLYWLILTATVIIIDQLTKGWAQSGLTLYHPVKILPVFNLTLAHNQGAAFSFLAGEGGWQRWFLSGLAILACVALLIWLTQLKPWEKLQMAALTLILGGALGNLVGRLLNGYVIDFLDFHWQWHHFPAFNIADSAITLGAIFIILDMLLGQKRHD